MNIRWFRDRFSDAVWESSDLNAYEKAVAEAYSRHARNQNGEKAMNGNLAWLTYPRLMEISGIKRRARVVTVQEALVEKGWFVVEHEVPRRSTLYRLVIPSSAASSDAGTSESEDANPGGSDGGTSGEENADPASSDGDTTRGSAERAASSTVGTSVVPFWGSGSSDGGTLPPVPKEKPLPPTPSVEASQSEPVENREGGGSNSDLEKQKIKILEEVRDLRPFWSKPKIMAQVEIALADGRPIDLIAATFPLVAADKITRLPARLSSEHPWWEVGAKKLTPTEPARPAGPAVAIAKCAECDENRTVPKVTGPAGVRVPCGCHPDVVAVGRRGGPPAPPAAGPITMYAAPPSADGRVLTAQHEHRPGLGADNAPICRRCYGAWTNDPRSVLVSSLVAATEGIDLGEAADATPAQIAKVIKLVPRRAS